MKFLLDTDICSAHMRRPARFAHRLIQHAGQVAISAVNLAELYAGAYKHSQTNRLLTLIADLLQEVQVVDFDSINGSDDCLRRIGSWFDACHA